MDDSQLEKVEAAIEKALKAAISEHHPCVWSSVEQSLLRDMLTVAQIFKRGVVWALAMILLLGTALMMKSLVDDVGEKDQPANYSQRDYNR